MCVYVVWTRKDMELLEKRYLDGDFTPFSEDIAISEQNDSPGMHYIVFY